MHIIYFIAKEDIKKGNIISLSKKSYAKNASNKSKIIIGIADKNYKKGDFVYDSDIYKKAEYKFHKGIK